MNNIMGCSREEMEISEIQKQLTIDISYILSRVSGDIENLSEVDIRNLKDNAKDSRIYTDDIIDRLYRAYTEDGKLMEIKDSIDNIVDTSKYSLDNEVSFSNIDIVYREVIEEGDRGGMNASIHPTYEVEATILSGELEGLKVAYTFKDMDDDGVLDDYKQEVLDRPDNLVISALGQINNYEIGTIEESQIDRQILSFIEAVIEEKGYKVPKYFIYGTMLVEGGIVDSSSLYEDSLSDIYTTLMKPLGGESQYKNGDIYNGSIIPDSSVMIGAFQISSAYYRDWVKNANEILEVMGIEIPEGITNRVNGGNPLYLPDVILGKVEKASKAYKECDEHMKLHYPKTWETQDEVVKEFMGVMWYNLEYHGGRAGVEYAKAHDSIIDYYYYICKEVGANNDYLDFVDVWNQASSKDNKTVELICSKVDKMGDRGHLEGFHNYADEGYDTFLGDWVYAPKCLHFGLKKLRAVLGVQPNYEIKGK